MNNYSKINSDSECRLLSGFLDPLITPKLWNSLVTESINDVIFMTWHWQKVWWEVFGRGKLLLIVVIRKRQPFAIAPLFAEAGMVFFVGSGCADSLDFIGSKIDSQILEDIINLAISHVPDFLGCRLYHIPKTSPTLSNLKLISKRLKFQFFDEGELPIPKLSIKNNPVKAFEAIQKKSLIRHERWFLRNGLLNIEFYNDVQAQIHFNDFFEQHKNRWAKTPFPSLFNDPVQKTFYKSLCRNLSEMGWFRFTRVIWEDRSISFHFGFNYNGCYIWYKPSFDIAFAKRSPGEVLLRQLIVRAIDEGAHTFDFGLGDETFKNRFTTEVDKVCTCGIYPLPK